MIRISVQQPAGCLAAEKAGELDQRRLDAVGMLVSARGIAFVRGAVTGVLGHGQFGPRSELVGKPSGLQI